MNLFRKGAYMALAAAMSFAQITPAHAIVTSQTNSNLSNEQVLQVTNEITIGNLIDFHYMVPGQEKYQIISINPQGAKISVSSSDETIAIAEVVDTPVHITGNQDLTCTANTPNERDDTREIKVKALKKGNATITVTAEKEPYETSSVTFEVNVLSNVQEGTQRFDESINKDWHFALAKDLDSSMDPSKISDPNFNVDLLEKVNLPHTWNIDDVENQLNKHYGVGYYRKVMQFPSETYANKEIFIDFGASNKVSELYINGTKVGKHEGGYARFRYDITDLIELDKENIIVMKVDNTIGGTVMPLSGGFAYHGGIYRDSYVTAVNPVTFDKLDYGSSAVYLTQSEVSKNSAKLNVKAGIRNYGDNDDTVKVNATIYEEDGVTQVASFDNELNINTNETAYFNEDFVVENPHLWNGTIDPYQYVVEITLSKDEEVLERARERIGFRFFEILKVDDPRADKGAFLLNGEPYLLAGVAQHQDRENMGNAITHKEMDEDIAFVSEIGATCLRLSHYQHDRYMYDLASERGIVTWAEIPNVNTVGSTSNGDSFLTNAKQQLTELIRQNYNATGILMWGIHNEQWPKQDLWVNKVLDELYQLGHMEDPTRYIAVATAQSQTTPLSWQSDVSAWNKYFGWYEGANIDGFGPWVDKVKEFALNNDTVSYAGTNETFTTEVNKTIGMSEYGTGNNIWTHELTPPDHVKNISSFQSEEYANKYHEITWKQIKERPWIWGTFIWNMFDFSQPGVVSEGGIVSRNTKGLMSFDRSLKKDQFYFYKANWSQDPMVYITSRRYDKRYDDKNFVRVYSNMDEVELYVNGESVGLIKRSDEALSNTKEGNLIRDPGLGIFHFDGEKLQLSEYQDYTITAVGRKIEGGKTVNEYTDTAVIQRLRDYRIGLESSAYIIDDSNKTISKVPSNETVETLLNNITVLYNGAKRVLDGNGNEITDLSILVSKDIQIEVTSEDGANTEVYTLADNPISAGTSASASSTQSPHIAQNLTDGNMNTRWTAVNSSYPQSFTIDLGEVTDIYQFTSLFYGEAPRTYQYTISTSIDGKTFNKVIDRSNNTESKWVSDKLDSFVSARYVRMDLSGIKGVGGGNAALWEFMVYGFQVKSDSYIVDNETKQILGVKPVVTADELLKKINVHGNYESLGILDKEGNAVTGNNEIGENAVLWISLDDVNKVEYQIQETIATNTPISQNREIVEVVDVKPGSNASYINDGNTATFWNATNGFNPARYVVIDLGTRYYLTQSEIEFYQGGQKRYYGYRILGSNDGVNFEEIINETANKDKEKNSHDMGVEARYLKVEVTGTTPVSVNFAAAVREFKAYGWSVSDYYEINHTDKTITNVVDMTSVDEFFRLLGLRGNFNVILKENGEAVPNAKYITEGMTLSISDTQGNHEQEYTIVTGMNNVPISRNKPVQAKTKAGSEPKYAVDGDMSTFWNGPMTDPNSAEYPVNFDIDLAEGEVTNGKKIEYNITKVITNWYEAGNRSYQFEYTVKPALGLPILWHDGNANTTSGEVIVTNDTNNGSDVKVSEFSILVNKCTPNISYLAAAIREIDIYGWYLGSSVYEVTESSINNVQKDTNIKEFRENLDIRGNFLYTLLDENGNKVNEGLVRNGMKVCITDIDGNEFIYDIKVESNDEYKVIVNGELVYTGAYNDKVTVTAPVVEGQTFTAWLWNGKVVSTDETYTFFLSRDMDLTASYEAVEMKAEALLTNTMLVKRADTKADIKFVAQLVVPDGYTVENAGLVWSSKEEAELSLENTNLKPTYITRISNTNQFSVTIKGMPTGKFIRGRIYATLVDSEGNESIVYSEEARVVNK